MENSREQNLSFGNRQRATLSVQTIQRAAAILRCFSEDNSELSLTFISQLVGLHKSTVSRLLLALQSEGYVAQNPENGKWRLGLGLLGLAGLVLERMNIRELAQGSLSMLAEQTMETISISVRDGAECINIEHIPSPRPIQYAGRLGRKAPLHCTSVGRVFLAFLPVAEWDALLSDSLRSYTEHTVVDRQALKKSLVQVKKQGYAVVHEELDEGLSAIAAPIWNHTAQVVAAISVSGPTYRMGPGKIDSFVAPVLKAAQEISLNLGYAASLKEVA